MTPSFETHAAIRFGFGPSPGAEMPRTREAMLALLNGPDLAAADWPIAGFDEKAAAERALGLLRKARREKVAGAEEDFKAANRAALVVSAGEMRHALLRAITSPDGLRERLVRFWADHFSVNARGKGLRDVTSGYIEDAIRPNITGNFRDLLRAASLHPVMLIYLDQVLSIGPQSRIGQRAGRGLNENLAREILELHTLGVGGAYTQADVRQFAELLTGLYYNFRTGFKYRVRAAEPGAETLLGETYGDGRTERLADIHAALDDLARHPDTARHIARKLAVHFVADDPDPKLVAALEAVFRDSDGDLMQVYAALLAHPASWADFGAKARQPFDYIVAAFRALGTDPGEIANLNFRKTRQFLKGPMAVMGQPWQQAPGPDGWPEALEDWITPQGLAARVEWALMAINAFARDQDPVVFAANALGDVADERMRRIVGLAESRAEGMALVLASPEFNRR